MSSPPAADIRQSVWSKLTQNLGNSTLCLVTGATVGAVRADPALSRLLGRMGDEARAIMRAHGIPTEGAVERPGGGQSPGLIGHKPSMLQDYERGRPMEIEAQLMAPLAFGRAAGVATPTLDALIPRSEEHTSELQSQSNLVCRLLLEKKKTYNKTRLIAINNVRRMYPIESMSS